MNTQEKRSNEETAQETEENPQPLEEPNPRNPLYDGALKEYLSSPPTTRGRKTQKYSQQREAKHNKAMELQCLLAKFGYSLRGSSQK